MVTSLVAGIVAALLYGIASVMQAVAARAASRGAASRGAAGSRAAGIDPGLLVTQPPVEAGWIAGMTAPSPAAYLQTMFVVPEERDTGVGAVLVRTLHARLDSTGVAVTLLHHSQVNPLSGPFWNRMGYRPLWTSWEARPVRALR